MSAKAASLLAVLKAARIKNSTCSCCSGQQALEAHCRRSSSQQTKLTSSAAEMHSCSAQQRGKSTLGPLIPRPAATAALLQPLLPPLHSYSCLMLQILRLLLLQLQRLHAVHAKNAYHEGLVVRLQQTQHVCLERSQRIRQPWAACPPAVDKQQVCFRAVSLRQC